MKEIIFILFYFFINLIIIDTNYISVQNYSNNIYKNFIDYSYSKTLCFENKSNNNFNVISKNFEYCRICAKAKKKNQNIVKNVI